MGMDEKTGRFQMVSHFLSIMIIIRHIVQGLKLDVGCPPSQSFTWHSFPRSIIIIIKRTTKQSEKNNAGM